MALAIHQALSPFAEGVAVKNEAPVENKVSVEDKTRVRIGVACGSMPVSTEAAQPAPTGQPVLTGEPIRLALSLVRLAVPGETIVSAAVQHALGDLLATEPLPIGANDLAHRVRTLREPGAAPRPFVGRAPERRQLEAAVADCRTRHTGQVILIRGEAGIGKTRLAEQLAVYTYGYGFTCYRALILDFGGLGANDVTRALMINLLGITPGMASEGRRQAVDVATRNGLMGDPLAPELRAALNEMLDLLQPDDLEAAYQAMAPAAREAARQRLLGDLVYAACRQAAVLLAVEDIHWASPATLAQLAVLATITRDRPVILAMTTRAEHDPINHAWRVQAQGCHLTTIDLGPLSATEAIALAAHYDHGKDVFGHSCIQRAEGHPLFLDQLLRMTQLNPGSLPGSVQSLVLARTDRLEPLDRQVLAAAAVLGQRFSLLALAHLLEEPPSRLQSLGPCDRLVEQALLRPEGEYYLFTHALIHEAVYAAILKSQRTEWHVRAAAWFAARDPELKARHLDAAGDAQAPGAYLEVALHEATHYRTERAQRYWLAALRGELLCTLGHTVDAVAAFRQTLTLAEDACACCRAWIGIADGLQVLDRYDEALATLAHAETDARECPDSLALVQMAALRGAIYFPLGNIGAFGACLGAHEQALGLARQAGSVEAEAHALSGLGDAYYQRGQIRTAHQHFDACVRLARQHQLLRIEAANLPMRGVTHFLHNELAAAMDDCRRADEIAGRIGDLRTATLTSIAITLIHLCRAHWQTAKDESERGLELARRLGSLRFEAQVLSQLALALAELGERSRAAVLLEHALTLSLDSGPAYGGPVILGYLAVITANDERRHQALAQGEALLAQDCVSHCHLHFYQMAIEASLAAARYTQRLADYTHVEPLPWADFFVCRGCALAHWSQGVRTQEMRGELETLLATDRQAELLAAIPVLEAALQSG